MIELRLGKVGDGHEEFSQILGVMADVIGSMVPVWRAAVHPYMTRHAKKQFKTEGTHGGKPWAGYGNEPKYEAYKKDRVGHLKVLRWHESLSRGRLPPSTFRPSHPDHIFQATSNRVTIGTSTPWAKRLTKGGTGPRGEKFPGRIIYAMTERQRDELTSLIQQMIIAIADAGTLRAARASFQQAFHSMIR